MIPIIRWEISRRRGFIIWWTIGVLAMIVLLLSIYPSIHRQAAQLNAVMQQLPESLRALRGGDSDLTSPVGYLNAEVFYITLPLLLIILAVNLGGSILARDEQERTLELILARPISRGAVLAGKAVSAVLIIGFIGLAAGLATLVLARVVGLDISSVRLFYTVALTTLFSASFGALAFALSAASLLSRRLSVAAAVVASFGGYLLQSLSSLSDYIKKPAELLPYHYFVPKDMLEGIVSRSFIVYMAGISIGCIVIAYLGFRRRDLS